MSIVPRMNEEPIPHGEAGVEWLKAAFAEYTDPVRQHAAALRSIHLDLPSVGLDMLMSRYAMQLCRDFVAAGVACQRPDVELYAPYALIRYSWPTELEQETAELLRLYIRSGYCRLNNQEDAFGCADRTGTFGPGFTHLEAALRSGNIPAAIVLVEEGERIDLVPKTQLKDGAPFGNMLDLARTWWADQDIEPHLIEASMRHRISLANQPVLAGLEQVHSRTRRARAL